MARADSANGKTPQVDQSQRGRRPSGSHVGDRQSQQHLEPSLEALQQFVVEHGTQYDSYLATEPEREVFWCSGNRGVISFVQLGRHVLISGGLIAPDEYKAQLLAEFLEHTARLNLRPTFFCINEEDLPYFRDVDFRITKLGEDAIVDLADFEFRGKKFEWVRRQANYCARHGVVASEVGPDLMPADEWAATLEEVLEVCQDSLADKPQREELKFLDGRIGEHELGRRRLFIARSDDGNGRIEGLVVCNPMYGGRVWSTEIYRHRSDAVRGVVTFLMHHLILALRDEGVEAVNLCIVPGRNCSTPMPGDSPIVRNAFRLAGYFSLVFDMAGVDHFKSRYRPRYENRFLCTPQKLAPSAFFATFKAFGVFQLDYGKTARLIWERIKKRTARKSIPSSNS